MSLTTYFVVFFFGFVSVQDNSNNGNMEEWKQKAEDATQFLLVDIDQARNQLSQNWGWIVTSGVLTIALGTAAFLVPIFATGVAYNGTVLTLGATGLVSVIASIFAREHGQQQVKSALSGILYLGLSYYMGTHPQQGLDIITLTIATVIAAEGLYEAALAFRNENLEGRGWHAFSGIGSFIVGLALSANLPATGLVTPGYALGARLTSSGATKLAVGLTGKEIADDAKNKRNNL